MTIATVTLTQPGNLSGGITTTNLQAWGNNISGLFSGAGLTKTSDTGQVNWSTITWSAPTSGTDTSLGYEVWKFTDTLQTTKPVFLIVQYRVAYVSTGPNGNFYITIQPVNSTNGAGVSTMSFAAAAFPLSPHTTASGTSTYTGFTGNANCFATSDGGSFVLVLGAGFGAGSGGVNPNRGGLGTFYSDRTRDSSGAGTADGLVVGYEGVGGFTLGAGVTNSTPSGNQGAFYYVYQWAASALYSLGANGSSAANGVVLPGYVPVSMAAGSSIGVSAPPVICGGKLLPPILAAVAYNNADITVGNTFSVAIGGSSHTSYALGGTCSQADRITGSTTACLAVRYE